MASFVLVEVGCNMTASISVDAPNPGVVCVGDVVTISANITGGTAPYTYSWSNGVTSPSFTVPAPVNQTFILNVTDGDGCTALAIIHVKVNVWYVDINYSIFPTCIGDSLALIASTTAEIPGTTYTWSTGETGYMIFVTNSGTYSVSMTHPSVNCTAEATATITIETVPPPVPEIVGPTTLCPGQSANLTVNGGPFGSYLWSNGSSDPTLSVNDPGTYFVTVTNAEGCTGEDFIEIQSGGIEPVPNDPTPICQGQTTTVEVINAAEFTGFAWSNGGTGPSISVTSPGIYIVTATSSGGCTAVGSVIVVEISSNINISGTSTSVTNCSNPNGGVDISVSPAGSYTFSWSNGAITEDLTNLAAGSYTVTVTENGGCAMDATFNVLNDTAPPVATATSTSATCGQANGAIDLSVSPAGSYTFSWSNGATTEDLVDLAAGSYVVTVTSITTGCSANASATVSDNSFVPNITGVVSPVTSCVLANGAVDINVSPSGNYSFIWSNGETTQNLMGLMAGTYSVTASAGGSCTGSASFTVGSSTVPPSLSANVTPAVCGSAVGAIDLTIMPTGGYSFNWSNGETTEDLTNLLSGNYEVTVTSLSDGCTATDIYNVPNNSTSFTLDGVVSSVTSCGQPNGAIDLNVSPSGFYTYLWSNGEVAEDLSGIPTGTYTVTVTAAAGGCTGGVSFIVDEQLIVPSLSQNTTPATCGEPNGAVDLTVSPAATYTFLWSNGATTEDLQNLAAGSYAVTTTAANGCTAVASADVANSTINFNLTGNVSPNSSCTSPNGNIDLMVNLPGNYTFTWSNGSMTEDLQNLPEGDFSVTVTQGLTCTSTATFNVPDESGAPVLEPVATPANCGQSNGGGDLTVAPAVGNTFLWSNGETTEDLSGLAPGPYSVTCTGANGCTSTATVEVGNSNTNFIISLSPNANSSCVAPSGSIDLSVSPIGGYAFLWSNGNTTEDLSNLSSGNYSVTVTDISGCSQTETATVEGPAQPQVAVTGPASACEGTMATFAADLGFSTYLWSNGATASNTTVSQTGFYSVTVTDANGCTATDGQPFEGLPLPVPDINGPAAICGGDAVFSVTGGIFSQIEWNTGEVSQSITVSQSGIYTVTVTNGDGCTATASQSLDVGTSLLPAIATAAASCNGTATLDAGAGYANYLWSDGSTGQFLLVNTDGLYSVTVSDGSGCTGGAMENVVLPDVPQVQVLGNNSICQGGSTEFLVSNSFPQILWSTGEISQNITVSQPGGYSVTVTDSDGCTATASQTLTVGAGLSPGISPTLVDCDGTSTLDAGGGYSSYLWSDGSTGQLLLVNVSGEYAVTVSDANGCTGETAENILLPTSPQVQVIGVANLCEGDETTLSATGNFDQYLWSTGEITPEIAITQGGTYSVTVSDANGCTATDGWVVNQLQPDFIMLETSACSPQDTGTVQSVYTNQFGCDSTVVVVTVLVQPAFTNIELNACVGEGAVFNNVTIPAGGSQDFVFTAANGCDSIVSVTVSAFPEVDFGIEAKASCFSSANGSISVSILGGKQPFQYSLNSGPFGNDPYFVGLPSGGYTVAVSDGNGCVFEQTAKITETLPMQVLVEDAVLSCENSAALLQPIVATASADVTYLWQDGSTESFFLAENEGIYEVLIDDGCQIQPYEMAVTWERGIAPENAFYIPNCFSPNDDGFNDVFMVFPGPDFEVVSFEFKIFDRWDDMMFGTEEVTEGWDGIYRGVQKQPAVYVWYVKATIGLCDGRQVEFFKEGGVTIIR